MQRVWKPVVCVAVLMALTACRSEAGGVKVGDAAPNWKGIVGIDDRQHGLADYAQAKLVVLVFTCNHCPVAVDYEERLVALHKDYKDKGVQIVAVNVNTMEADRLDKMKERAAAKGFQFPYLYDETQAIGRDYGAVKTPQVFVLGPDRKIVYTGAIDDNRKVGAVTKHYLRDALEALLAGKKPPEAETTAFGCGIKYDK